MGRNSSRLAAVLLVAWLALGFLYLRQRTEIALVRTQFAAKSIAEKRGLQRIADLEKELAATNAVAQKAQKQLAAQSGASRPAASTRDANGAVVLHMSEIVKEHPELAVLQQKEMRRNILRQYGAALASLNLPPAQLAEIKNLLVEREMSVSDAQQAARDAGLQPGTPGFAQAIQQANESVNQQINALMGPDGQRQLQNAQMLSISENQVANQYAPDFADAGVPLTADQSRDLAQLLNPMAARASGGPGTNDPDPQTWLTPRDQEMLTQAAQILSPAQVSVLKADRSEQNQRQSIMRPYTKGASAVMIIQ